ncbi:cache domain-containing protein [Candidatus Nitrososphaera sp. FF02]|uniref:cache domain-containing protein n=1 Tax=Candidatus Nitrososphaera sp. FF02 TaxID=3398226 RepID=UPI0039EB21A6
MNRAIGLYAAAVTTAILVISAGGMIGVGALEQSIIDREAGDVRALALATEARFSSAESLMELVAGFPQMARAGHVSEITAEAHGVPEDVEVEKRQAMKLVLQNPDIEAIAFLLPDGEMYVEEPFSRQMNLTRTNFAFRDYFQGAVNSSSTYLGEVYVSASSGASTSAVAVPVFSDGQLAGVVIGLMRLENLDRFASDMFEGDDGRRFVYADQHGHEVVYSNALASSIGNRPLAEFQPYTDALAGESGQSVQTIDGQRMFVAYSPVKAPGTTWALLSIQPHDALFAPVDGLRNALYACIGIAAAVGAGLGPAVAKSGRASSAPPGISGRRTS